MRLPLVCKRGGKERVPGANDRPAPLLLQPGGLRLAGVDRFNRASLILFGLAGCREVIRRVHNGDVARDFTDERLQRGQLLEAHRNDENVDTGSNFRFRAMGGLYRVVVRGTGVYLFAGGTHGHVTVQGSVAQGQLRNGAYGGGVFSNSASRAFTSAGGLKSEIGCTYPVPTLSGLPPVLLVVTPSHFDNV